MATIGNFDNALKQSIAFVVGADTDDVTGWETCFTAVDDCMCISVHVACKSTSGVQADIRIYDTNTTDWVYLIKDGPIPVGSSIVPVDNNKIVLKAGQRIDIRCKTPGEEVDALVSVITDVNA